MKIKRKKIDSKIERDIATGMIVSDNFLRNIVPIIDINNLKSNFVKTIARWCIDYHHNHDNAPNKLIGKIYEAETENLDEELSELIDDFLSSISDEYSNNNFDSDYVFKQAEKYLRKRTLEKLSSLLDKEIDNNNLEKAEQLIGNYKKVEKPISTGIDIFEDEDEIENAFDKEEDILFEMPGTLGQLIGPICREDFISISAPMKRGKTFWLTYFAIRALLAGLKVLFISLEMPKHRMILRFYQNFLGESLRPQKVDIPYFEDGNIEYKTVYKNGIQIARALKKAKAMKKMVRGGKLKLICQPARSLNSQSLRVTLDNYETFEGFKPDVIIDDYMDIHGPEPFSSKDKRHQIDETWAETKAIAAERNVAYITATQGNRATLGRDQTQEDISEDIRKLAHVTKMIALNQTNEEKKDFIMRVGILAERYGEFYTDDEVVVLQQLAIGKPYLDSRWKKDVVL